MYRNHIDFFLSQDPTFSKYTVGDSFRTGDICNLYALLSSFYGFFIFYCIRIADISQMRKQESRENRMNRMNERAKDTRWADSSGTR